MTSVEIYEHLRERMPDAVVGYEANSAQPAILIDAEEVFELALLLRDSEKLSFDRLLVISGVDWEGYDEKGKGKHRKIAQYGEDGKPNDPGPEGTGDLGLYWYLHSMKYRHSIALKARIARDKASAPSLATIWPTAAWAEREIFDFYGIEFSGHPDLRRMFLPEDWEGYPLRKDYPMPARYHDVPLEGLPLAVRENQQSQEEGA
ncbi:hypothetical protein DRQ53_07245 [bacterium]|nr:MAG: hypothetical protein DRQ53_07245 [bacterium]